MNKHIKRATWEHSIEEGYPPKETDWGGVLMIVGCAVIIAYIVGRIIISL